METCKWHPEHGVKLIETPQFKKKYGKFVCEICERFLRWAPFPKHMASAVECRKQVRAALMPAYLTVEEFDVLCLANSAKRLDPFQELAFRRTMDKVYDHFNAEASASDSDSDSDSDEAPAEDAAGLDAAGLGLDPGPEISPSSEEPSSESRT